MQSNYKPLNDSISSASKVLGIEREIVEKVYKAYCKALKTKMESLQFDSCMSKEEFDKLQTSINMPRLGKFYVDWHTLQK